MSSVHEMDCLREETVTVPGRSGAPSLQEVGMVFFKTCNRTHSDRLPVVDSLQCWGMVSCNW